MQYHLILIVLALIGIAEMIYLIRKEAVHQSPVCVIGDQCHTVWESPHSKTLGIPNDVLGMIFYAAVFLIEAMIVMRVQWGTLLLQAEALLITAGFFMSCYFFYLQWRVIRAWCFWCICSGITTLLMALALAASVVH